MSWTCKSCQWINNGDRCRNCNTGIGKKRAVAFTPKSSGTHAKYGENQKTPRVQTHNDGTAWG